MMRYRVQLLAAAALFSTGGAAIKACELSGWQIAGLRSLIAALVLLLLPAARRGWRPGAWLVAAAYAATVVLFVQANKLTTSASTTFLQSTAPIYVLLLAPRLLGERGRPRDIVTLAVIALGLSLFFLDPGPAQATAPDPVSGNLAAGAAGFTWALTVLGLRWYGVSSGGDSMAPIVAGNILAVVVCLPFGWPVVGATGTDWALLGFLGVFQIGLAYVFIARGISRVGALDASLLMLAEPALNPVWSWLVHAERPGASALLGGALVLGATIVKSWLDSRGTAVRRGA